jgi:hypothetical protein
MMTVGMLLVGTVTASPVDTTRLDRLINAYLRARVGSAISDSLSPVLARFWMRGSRSSTEAFWSRNVFSTLIVSRWTSIFRRCTGRETLPTCKNCLGHQFVLGAKRAMQDRTGESMDLVTFYNTHLAGNDFTARVRVSLWANAQGL